MWILQHFFLTLFFMQIFLFEGQRERLKTSVKAKNTVQALKYP